MTRKRIEVLLMGVLLLAVPAVATAFTASNGAVTDERTGLVWQQQDDGQYRPWVTAISYCEGLTLAGQSDWRLPNIKELDSITDDSRVDPAIDPIFTAAKSTSYWSSTTYPGNSNVAWYVTFDGGGGSPNGVKGNYYYVRCVRGGQ
ncbi:MAG: DUF1566 domain-containing protein [Methylococcaceae bacterium]|jgi:hypothetical protein